MAGWGAATFARGLRRAEPGGVWGVGWQPSSYHIRTAVRKKQSGHRQGARQPGGTRSPRSGCDEEMEELSRPPSPAVRQALRETSRPYCT